MNSARFVADCAPPFLKPLCLLVLLTGAGARADATDPETTTTTIWDSMSPLGDSVDVENRTSWRRVPRDLFTLEKNPTAAASDPGYYGREYAFQGDPVVENSRLTAVVHTGNGRLLIFPKNDSIPQSHTKKLELVPLEFKGKSARITSLSVLQNTGQDAALEVTFSDQHASVSAALVFDRTEIVEIQPSEDLRGLSIVGPIEYGIVPDFIADDLIIRPDAYPSAGTICLPAENLFIGLLEGHDDMLVATWPDGKQRSRLTFSGEERQPRTIESFDLENDGESLYLGVLTAPGIWHKEELERTYLEKEVTIDWKRPFPAKWITQLPESRIPTTFAFRETKSSIWRGVIGHYTYPVWFDDGRAFYYLSKKIPPRGESIIYFLERRDTPDSILAPADFLKATLGRAVSARILDLRGRKLRTHHRRGDENVHRACTCGCTEAIQIVFEAGEEARRTDYVEAAVDDMVFFVTQHMRRIEEYRDFARDMTEFLARSKESLSDLKSYLEEMEEIVQEIPDEYESKRELIRSLDYAAELARETKALARKEDPENLKEYETMSMAWRRMGGAQDDLVSQCHRIARKLFQEAGYAGTVSPKAAEFAREIRERCRKCLRNADGYEIWPDY